ncbi:hypothetical protein A2442_01570 [Candidatus Campbellbacteria bacterium RIFOXYC2_FULL_35_25]|uniref:Uncharacterized protein n=1 Tax=Candidatus Campbellbacteria bacterium RIFOXYC2_FULL_35_25 TaxID=1797582 RepID=A0A1F5EHF0_9BACT|nr:MAG: hypothetical protein A2442_01570 [Candidatus Campbellbacteria bacterium RIFOXYC2_FULL_35_25]
MTEEFVQGRGKAFSISREVWGQVSLLGMAGLDALHCKAGGCSKPCVAGSKLPAVHSRQGAQVVHSSHRC